MDTHKNIEKLNVSDASERLVRTLALEDDIARLRYVSDARREALLKLNIKTVRDMFLHAPHRYLDFGHTAPIGLVNIGQDASVVGRVDKVNVKNPRPNLSIVEVFVIDKTGVINATFFKQPWVANQIHVGDMIALSGKVIFNFGFKQMRSPFFEILSDKDNQLSFAKILPIHTTRQSSWFQNIL